MTIPSRWLIGLLSLVSALALSLPTSAHLGQEHPELPIDAPLEAVQPQAPASPAGSAPVSGDVQLRLGIQPPLSDIVPAQQPIRLRLEAIDSQQMPVPRARWQITLHTPAKTPWLTTDFPIVEGTTLLNASGLAGANALEVETLLPIRGVYRLQATVTAPGMAAPVAQSFLLDVPENPVKYRNAATLAVILLLVGLLGGWLIAAQPSRSIGDLSQAVRLLLSAAAIVAIVALLTVNLSAERAEHSHTAPALLSRTATEAGSLKLEYLGDPIATVGKLADLSARLIDVRTSQPVQNATFRLRAKDAEHGVSVLSVTGRSDAAGVFTWQQQFFDGAPHQLQIEAVSPTGPALRLNQPIEVEGIAPPLSVRLITLSYMTATVAIGMAIGFGGARLQRRRRLRQSLKPSSIL